MKMFKMISINSCGKMFDLFKAFGYKQEDENTVSFKTDGIKFSMKCKPIYEQEFIRDTFEITNTVECSDYTKIVKLKNVTAFTLVNSSTIVAHHLHGKGVFPILNALIPREYYINTNISFDEK